MESKKSLYYLIADHLRTTIFALADGASFQSKGRGYILKKLIKKAVLLSFFLGFSPSDLLKFSEKLIEVNSQFYSHLKIPESLIRESLAKEINYVESFIRESVAKISQYCQNHSLKLVPAEKIFFWYDTKGIPLELIEYCLKNEGYNFSSEKFEQLLSQQKKRAQADRQKKKIAVF